MIIQLCAHSIQFIHQYIYKSFNKLVCTGKITYILRHNTRYVNIYKDEYRDGNYKQFANYFTEYSTKFKFISDM